MDEGDEKVDAGEDALFEPSEVPPEETNELNESDGKNEGGAGGVRSLNKKRIAIVACIFLVGVLAAAMFGLRGGSSPEKKKKESEHHVGGTSAEREVERLENMKSVETDESRGTERPPDKKRELRRRDSEASKAERLKKKLEEEEQEDDRAGQVGGAENKGPWEKAREQARRRHARAYHDEAFQARRAKVFATVETPSGRSERTEQREDIEGVESVESVRADLAERREQVEQRVAAKSEGRKPLPASATEKKEFLQAEDGATTRNAHRLKEPISPYVVQAGTMLELVLETGINSELPGLLRGRIARPIYDSRTGNHLLIPAGAVVLGKYNSRVEEGQTRAQVVWTRLILPNGKSLKLGNIPGADLQGKSGYSDRVDNQWGEVGAGVALTSLLSAGAGAAAGPQDRLSQRPEEGALSEAGKNVAKTGKGIVDRELDKKPVIKIRAGMRVGALVHEDLVLEPYETREAHPRFESRQVGRR